MNKSWYLPWVSATTCKDVTVALASPLTFDRTGQPTGPHPNHYKVSNALQGIQQQVSKVAMAGQVSLHLRGHTRQVKGARQGHASV